MSILTILDVPHVKMDAWHQNTNSLGALVAQQLHHLRVENRIVITETYAYSAFSNGLQIRDHYSPLLISWKPTTSQQNKVLSSWSIGTSSCFSKFPHSSTFSYINSSSNQQEFPNWSVKTWIKTITVAMLNNDIAQLRQWLIEWNQNNPKNTFALKATLAGC